MKIKIKKLSLAEVVKPIVENETSDKMDNAHNDNILKILTSGNVNSEDSFIEAVKKGKKGKWNDDKHLAKTKEEWEKYGKFAVNLDDPESLKKFKAWYLKEILNGNNPDGDQSNTEDAAAPAATCENPDKVKLNAESLRAAGEAAEDVSQNSK